MSHWVDAVLVNARAGRCMCGRDECVEYGPHPFGYGPCCIHCQREWSRQHGGARWQSNAERIAMFHAERARAAADGRDPGEVTRAWNRGLPPFHTAARVTTDLSHEWRDEYEAHLARARATA